MYMFMRFYFCVCVLAYSVPLHADYSRLSCDFQTNKKICEEVAIIPSKRLRNKIAGFTTVRHATVFVCYRSADVTIVQHLMKRIQRGPVRGISLKLQEEERERRMDIIPDRSAIDHDTIEVRRNLSQWVFLSQLVFF